MHADTGRFFIALLPPESIQAEITEIKQHFSHQYHSRHALKSPPHVTLQPPFQWELSRLDDLETALQDFVANYRPIPMILEGFAAFKPRVIYVNVIKTPELMQLQPCLMTYLETNLNMIEKSKHRSFTPHMTVAFRDLTKENFYQGWAEFETKPLHYKFIAPGLTLLQHDGQQWNVQSEFRFAIPLESVNQG